jgi:hypothetical protein
LDRLPYHTTSRPAGQSHAKFQLATVVRQKSSKDWQYSYDASDRKTKEMATNFYTNSITTAAGGSYTSTMKDNNY